MIQGKAIYDKEIMELKEKLDARGIVLIVIKGNKNKSDIEFGSALQPDDILHACSVLRAVATEFESDWKGIMQRAMKGESNGPIR